MRKLIFLFLFASFAVHSQIPAAITYQGSLKQSGGIANGSYDFEFKLFDEFADGTGVQQGPTVSQQVTVTDGIFSVNLDFGFGVFEASELYLEISVKDAGSPDPFTVLSPRQALSSVPFAHKAESADFVPANSIGSVEINSSQVQRRISNGCAVGSTINSINEDGSVVCEANNGLTEVTGADVVDGSLTGDDIATNSVPGTDLVSNSVGSTQITNSSITTFDIQDNTIRSADIQDGQVTGADIADGSVTGTDIANLSITGGDIAANAIISAHISDNSISSTDITNGTITNVDISDGSIIGNDLSNSINLNGTLTWNCPNGMTRAGSWCIDNTYRSANTATASLDYCHDRGMHMCPMEAIMTCDAGNVLNSSNNSCGSITDCQGGSAANNDAIRTSTLSGTTGGSSSFGSLLQYQGCGNSAAAVSEGASRIFFCCKPVGR